MMKVAAAGGSELASGAGHTGPARYSISLEQARGVTADQGFFLILPHVLFPDPASYSVSVELSDSNNGKVLGTLAIPFSVVIRARDRVAATTAIKRGGQTEVAFPVSMSDDAVRVMRLSIGES